MSIFIELVILDESESLNMVREIFELDHIELRVEDGEIMIKVNEVCFSRSNIPDELMNPEFLKVIVNMRVYEIRSYMQTHSSTVTGKVKRLIKAYFCVVDALRAGEPFVSITVHN